MATGRPTTANMPLMGGQTPANMPLMGGQTPANMPLMGGQTPANMPLMGGQTPANMPLMGGQTPANVPLMGGQTPANMPLLGSQKPAATLQPPTFPAQQSPTNLQPQFPTHETPTNVQSQLHMAGQQAPANMQLQPRPEGLHSPASMQPYAAAGQHIPAHMVFNRAPAGGMLPPVGVTKHTPAATPLLLQTASKHSLGREHPLSKGDRLMFATSDDNMMLKQIQSTHVPDGREIDVKPFLYIIDDIFKRAVPSVAPIATLESPAPTEAVEDKPYQSNFLGVLEVLAYIIDRISCEITCKCSSGGDAHVTAISILNMLTNYSWDAKLVLALSAFSATYGEFWLVAQSYNSNQLAKAVAILKQLPEILENLSALKPQFDAVKNLIKAMVDITKCIVEFRELPSHYITADVDALSAAMAHIPIAVYWTIRGILASASQITGLTLLGREHMVSTTEAWELSSLAHKLNNMHNHLRDLLRACYKYIDAKKHMEDLHNLKNLFITVHIDNMRPLKALMKDELPIVDGVTKKRVNLEVLRRKNVLLLISDLDIQQEELAVLEQLYTEGRQQQTSHDAHYEVVWLPIVDPVMEWNESKRRHFENLQASMPWYTLHHPSLIDRAVIQFIKEEWQFKKKPILVVIDPQGRVVCPNALHMMWIWGILAFPFTTAREEALWKEETWRLEMLVDGIDPVILNWISEGRYICLYGGDDMEWIRKFTTTANAVAQASGISLGMVYVGKSNPKERIRRNTLAIAAENLSHCWRDLTPVWFYWIRLESMWHSKLQLGRTVENDPIMHEIVALLSYDGSEGGWAVFARGSAEMTRAKGGQFLTCLQEYDVWKDQVGTKGFLPALRDHLQQLHTPHHCNRLVLPGTAGKIPERIVCSECGRVMERFVMYQCCEE